MLEVAGMKIYTIKELEKMLKVTGKSLMLYIKQGKLRGRKVGGKWLVTEEALIDFLRVEESKERPHPEPSRDPLRDYIGGIAVKPFARDIDKELYGE